MSVAIGIKVGERGEERTPFMVRCGACEHQWAAAYLPLEMAQAAKLLLGLHCPMCAQDSKKIFFASSSPPSGSGERT